MLAAYWFHPLCWAAYVLFCRDMELACDERVIRDYDVHQKRMYSEALLACSLDRRNALVYPLAFGEVGVKERIRSVLHYKKPAFWVIVAAVAACVVAAVCFLTDPVDGKEDAVSAQADTAASGGEVAEDAGGRAGGSPAGEEDRAGADGLPEGTGDLPVPD